jgi:hypothetical protein
MKFITYGSPPLQRKNSTLLLRGHSVIIVRTTLNLIVSRILHIFMIKNVAKLTSDL